jgi:hypothetical protein
LPQDKLPSPAIFNHFTTELKIPEHCVYRSLKSRRFGQNSDPCAYAQQLTEELKKIIEQGI